MRNPAFTPSSLWFRASRLPGLAAFLQFVAQRTELARQRRALGRLDRHLLKDIGVDPERARREARRPRWDAPDHWRA